jgi:benzil reductase ((S)-benzoin forming)
MNLYLVTGTTRGLGKALADEIARSGDNHLIALARAPEGPIPGGHRFAADLADTAALEALWPRIAQHLGMRRYAKAVLINNAGVVAPVGPIESVDADELDRALRVNLVAPMLLMRGFLRTTAPVAELRRIVNISSGAGRRPIFGWAAYCAAKAGLDMASRVVALEASARGLAVEVASLAPGVFDTDMQAHVRGQSPEAFADVERFRQMKEKGELRPAADVAADILRAEAAGRLAGDGVLDLRSLTP